MDRFSSSWSSIGSGLACLGIILTVGAGCSPPSGAPADADDDFDSETGITDTKETDRDSGMIGKEDSTSGSGQCPDTELEPSTDFAALSQQQYATLCAELQEAGKCSTGNGSVTVSPPDDCGTWSENYANWSMDDSECGVTVEQFLDCQCNCGSNCRPATQCADQIRDSSDAGTEGDTADSSNQDAG